MMEDLENHNADVEPLNDQDEDEGDCICGTTKDCFFVACDKCNRWLHGDCVNITEEEARDIENYYCESCQNQDPALLAKMKNFFIEHPRAGFTSLSKEIMGKQKKFYVEDILKKEYRVGDPEPWYLVKWVGYTSKANSWVPKINLSGCQWSIDKFEARCKAEADGMPQLNIENIHSTERAGFSQAAVQNRRDEVASDTESGVQLANHSENKIQMTNCGEIGLEATHCVQNEVKPSNDYQIEMEMDTDGTPEVTSTSCIEEPNADNDENQDEDNDQDEDEIFDTDEEMSSDDDSSDDETTNSDEDEKLDCENEPLTEITVMKELPKHKTPRKMLMAVRLKDNGLAYLIEWENEDGGLEPGLIESSVFKHVHADIVIDCYQKKLEFNSELDQGQEVFSESDDWSHDDNADEADDDEMKSESDEVNPNSSESDPLESESDEVNSNPPETDPLE